MKQIKRLLKQAWKNLFLRKSRTLMTSLGIIIGTSTVVVVINIGMGSQESIRQQYSNMSVTSLTVMGPRGRSSDVKTEFSIDDIEPIMDQSEFIKTGSIVVTGTAAVSWEDYTNSYAVTGSNTTFEKILNFEYLSGQFFTKADEESRERVIVLGYNVAEDLTDGDIDSIVDSTVKINKKTYDVVGVLAYRGGTVGSTAVDDNVYLPYSTTERYVLENTSKANIQLDIIDVEHVSLAIEQIKGVLREEHKLDKSEADDFQLRDMGQLISSAIESAETTSFLLASVGTIVLVVGGIGIMNVMYISVQERTKEIGIKKAIGAKKHMILNQFIVEAVLISTLAGIVGLVTAYGITKYVEGIEFAIVNALSAYVIGFLASVSVGIFFGFYPAKKASELHPIDALRHE